MDTPPIQYITLDFTAFKTLYYAPLLVLLYTRLYYRTLNCNYFILGCTLELYTLITLY